MISSSPAVLVFSRPRSAQSEAEFRRMVDRVLVAAGHLRSAIVPHLYDASPGGPVFQFLQQLTGDLLLLAPLYPRAAELVLRANGVRYRLIRPVEQASASAGPGERRLWAFDYREYSSLDVLQQTIAALAAEVAPGAEGPLAVASAPQEVEEQVRPRWYPVIDDEKCISCFECLNFCLFGVYDIDASGHVFAAQPDECRPGCPACARVCPQEAIFFPLYPDPKIAGGDAEKQGTFVPIETVNFSPQEKPSEGSQPAGGVGFPGGTSGSPSAGNSSVSQGGSRDNSSQREVPRPDGSDGLDRQTLEKWLEEAEGIGP